MLSCAVFAEMPKKAAPAAPKQTPEEIAAAAAKAEAAAILAEQTLAVRDQPVWKQLVVRASNQQLRINFNFAICIDQTYLHFEKIGDLGISEAIRDQGAQEGDEERGHYFEEVPASRRFVIML